MEELSEAEQARAAEMKRQWIEAFGDDEFIRKCYHAGLIRGWRDVKSVRLLTEEEKAAYAARKAASEDLKAAQIVHARQEREG